MLVSRSVGSPLRIVHRAHSVKPSQEITKANKAHEEFVETLQKQYEVGVLGLGF